MATADTAENAAGESSVDMLTRQRMETRELQSKIQVMKKGVSKGNKKEKKQMQEDISTLERDITERHQKERDQLVSVAHVELAETVARKSRAQKRREKKEAQDGRINELIAGMDMMKSDGDVEREELLALLGPLGLRIVDIVPGKNKYNYKCSGICLTILNKVEFISSG